MRACVCVCASVSVCVNYSSSIVRARLSDRSEMEASKTECRAHVRYRSCFSFGSKSFKDGRLKRAAP